MRWKWSKKLTVAVGALFAIAGAAMLGEIQIADAIGDAVNIVIAYLAAQGTVDVVGAIKAPKKDAEQ